MDDTDLRLEQWIEEFGEVTSYSFMVYSYFGLRDNAVINQGITIFLHSSGFSDVRYMQMVEDVEEDLADAFGTKPGLNVQWIFPRNMSKEFDEIVISTIEDGFAFLDVDYEFYGRFGNVN